MSAKVNHNIKKTILKPELSEKLFGDEALIGRIAFIMGRSSYTIKRWIKKFPENLVLEPITEEIRKAYKLSKSEEITTTKRTVQLKIK